MKIGASQSSGQWPDDGEAPDSILSRLVVCLSGRRGPAINRVHDAALVRIQQPPRLAAFGRLFHILATQILRGFRISVPALWRLSHCGVDAQDSPLCVSGGCHIGHGGGVGGFVVGLF